MQHYKLFIQDLISLLKAKFEETKSIQLKNDFDMGVNMSYYEVLDLIKSQALAFDIPLKDLGLDNYDLEKYLLK